MIPAQPEKAAYDAAIAAIKATPIADLGEAASAVPRRAIATGDANNSGLVVTWVPQSISDLVAAKKRYLFGVSFTEVASAALIQIAAARHLQAPVPLIRDMVFSIFVAYTVSRDWVVEYANLHSTSILRQFEIDGRQVDRSDPMFAKNGWVNTSRMNSTAVHIFGYMIVESAPEGGVLKQLRDVKGTPFTDKNLSTPQGKLISELAKTLKAEDREAVQRFEVQFRILIRAVDAIFGDVGINLADAFDRAAKMRPSEF
jgi:hypothetical protein